MRSLPVNYTGLGGEPIGVPEPLVTGPLVAAPSYYAGRGLEADAARVEMGLFDTIEDSLFGDVYAEGRWRPIELSTFFTEGWLEPWAGGPAGQSGLTPRHGWLGAFEGVFYRLWVTGPRYQNNVSKPYGGDAYSGDFVIFLPFSRRFELAFGIPFVTASGTEDPKRGYRSDFGDMVVGARFMLSETEAFTQTMNIDFRLPTGQTETGGNLMAITPRYEFWSNPVGAWVVRGGAGVSTPLNKNDQRPFVTTPGGSLGFGESTSQTAFVGDLAIGRYFRPHDVAFGDLVFYAASNYVVPFEDGNEPTYVGAGPGTRFHIADNWFFLNYWEFPMVGPKPFDYQMQMAILKVF